MASGRLDNAIAAGGILALVLLVIGWLLLPRPLHLEVERANGAREPITVYVSLAKDTDAGVQRQMCGRIPGAVALWWPDGRRPCPRLTGQTS